MLLQVVLFIALVPLSSNEKIFPPKGCRVETISHVNNTTGWKLECVEPATDDILNYLANTTRYNFVDIEINGCKTLKTFKPLSITLNSTLFVRHRELVKLTFRLCEIIRITDNTFNSLSKLLNINLSGNDLGWKEIKKEAFKGLPHLEILNLDYNNLGTGILLVDTFDKLPLLKELSLKGNHLHAFKPVLRFPSNTRKLDLTNNWLSNATISGGSPTEVCSIDYTQSGLTSLANGNFRNIQCGADDGITLRFNLNSFTSFGSHLFLGFKGHIKELDFTGVAMKPDMIKDLVTALTGRRISTLRLAETQLTKENLKLLSPLNTSNVESLDLRNNLIVFSGAVETRLLSQLQTIQSLDLSYNMVISSISFEVPMPNLRFLDLGHTEVPITPKPLNFKENSLKNLETLALEGAFIGKCISPIDDFAGSPPWFHSLGNLKNLSLANNYHLFQCLSIEFFLNLFKGMKNLEILSLYRTDFGEVDPSVVGYGDIFVDQARTIRVINFYGGSLTHRHIPGLIQNLTNLTHLNLGNNEIGYLYTEWFDNLSNLQVLDLHDNKITTVVLSIQLFPESLSELSIGQNAFSCDCQLTSFTSWLRNTPKVHVRDVNKAMCLTPLKYFDKQLKVSAFRKSSFVCNHGIAYSMSAAIILVFLVVIMICCYFRHDIKYDMATRRASKGRGDDGEPLLAVRRGSVKLIYDVSETTDQDWIDKYIDNITDCKDFNIEANNPDNIQVLGENHVNPLSKQIRDFRYQCRSTLLLVSKHFRDDLWPEVLANLNPQELQNIRFVLVLIDNLRLRDLPRELKRLANDRPCFRWPTAENRRYCGESSLHKRRRLFWKKLILAILPK